MGRWDFYNIINRFIKSMINIGLLDPADYDTMWQDIDNAWIDYVERQMLDGET